MPIVDGPLARLVRAVHVNLTNNPANDRGSIHGRQILACLRSFQCHAHCTVIPYTALRDTALHDRALDSIRRYEKIRDAQIFQFHSC